MNPYRVGILGATGTVGQRFIQLLENHPWFTISAVAASERSVGKRYADAVNWKMNTPIPDSIAQMTVEATAPGLECDFVFSGLDSSIAGDIETAFAKAGYPVISNSKNHRMDPLVPLLIADINPDHIDIIPEQKEAYGYDKGFIVTNPNCSTIGLVMGLQPLQQAYGIEQVIVTTLQAISGAGYPGVPSMDILDNVVPYIGGEEEKIEEEPLKIMGNRTDTGFTDASLKLSATCTRVPVFDGHLESVSVKLGKQASPEEVAQTLHTYQPETDSLNLPSAPKQFVIVKEEADRPQPRIDRYAENGMATVVGRIRSCPILDTRFMLLSHNTIRGAAGVAILNAELLVSKQYITNSL
jgi:aspartate-semialdehyde dehydrogenase